MRFSKHRMLNPLSVNRVGKALFGLWVVLAVSGPGWAAGAAATITAIAPSEVDGKILVTISLTGRIRPAISIMDPNEDGQRLVIDLPGAAKAKGLSHRFESPYPALKLIRVGVHPDKVRIVLDLDPKFAFRAKPYLFTNALVIELIPEE